MSASIHATGLRGQDFTIELRIAANYAIADARRAGLSRDHADVMETAVRAAMLLSKKAPKGSVVAADIQLQENPVDPAGFSASVLVTAYGAELVAKIREHAAGEAGK